MTCWGRWTGVLGCRFRRGRGLPLSERRPHVSAGAPLSGEPSPGPDSRASGCHDGCKGRPSHGGSRALQRRRAGTSGPVAPAASFRRFLVRAAHHHAGEGLELQGSHASVHSPEHRAGAGTDQRKSSLSGRWSGTLGRFPVYGLIEWARTSEAGGFFVFHSVLAEGAWTAAVAVSTTGSSDRPA